VHRHLIWIAGTAMGCAAALGPWAPGPAAASTAYARNDTGRTGAPAAPGAPGAPPVVRNRLLAVALLTGYGWSERQWHCLDHLWRRESRWNHRARNRRSGAYGIPQALPAAKMRSAGTDWRHSATTQIRWGLGYIARRYGSPCTAWGHSEADGWY
jgi:hypothetical protein